MARPGPAPSARRVGHSPQAEWTDVEDVPFVEGEARDLPAREWHELTRAWWAQLRTMPHARTWREGDWVAALDLAILKERFYTGLGSTGEISEMRKREDLLGMTSEARVKLRIRYVPTHGETTDTAAPAPVVALSPKREERDRKRLSLLDG